MPSRQKELKELRKAAEAQGWRIEKTKKGHWKFLAPNGEDIVIVAGTPSSKRGFDHAVADLRRYGFQWKGR